MADHVRAALALGSEFQQPLLEDRVAQRLATPSDDGVRIVLLMDEVEVRERAVINRIARTAST